MVLIAHTPHVAVSVQWPAFLTGTSHTLDVHLAGTHEDAWVVASANAHSGPARCGSG